MIYFIRHAQSLYNIRQSQIKQKYGATYMQTQQYQKAKFSKEYLDVDITQKGIQQAKQCKQKMKNTQVDLVIVSPLRRALTTCQIVFQNHSSNAKIIVDPAFREILCSSNDIGSKLKLNKKQFQNFDFSLIDDQDFWYLYNIQDQQIREDLITKINKIEVNKAQNGIQHVLQFLREHFKHRQQNPADLSLLKKVLPSLKTQKQILLRLLKQHKSIAVVSHSQNIKSFMGYKIKNCEIFEFSQQRLQALQIQ